MPLAAERKHTRLRLNMFHVYDFVFSFTSSVDRIVQNNNNNNEDWMKQIPMEMLSSIVSLLSNGIVED